MRQKPTVLAREIVASSRLFRVEELQLRFANGVERTYERLVGKGAGYGAVMVVALLDAESLGLEACFFVLIRTSEHDPDWARRFLAAVRARPEVIEAHRLAGDIDYILKVQVRNARAYDRFYQSLISEIRIQNVTALLSMEEMKATSALPIPPA